MAKQLERFIEVRIPPHPGSAWFFQRVKSAEVDPTCSEYKVGPGGIELRHIGAGVAWFMAASFHLPRVTSNRLLLYHILFVSTFSTFTPEHS